MQAVYAPSYQTARYLNPEENNMNIYRRKNVKCYTVTPLYNTFIKMASSNIWDFVASILSYHHGQNNSTGELSSRFQRQQILKPCIWACCETFWSQSLGAECD